ncbi:MAG: tetratricopeptide repeat protein [Bryobacteraceae bacterium]
MASLSKMIHRGVELLHQGRPEQAAALYRDVLERSPQNSDALHLLAVAVFQTGDARSAAGYAERAVAVEPKSADYWSNLGRYYLALDEAPRALDALGRALRLKPAHPLAHFNRALALARTGDRAAAAAELREYTQLEPRDPGGHHHLGNLIAEDGRHAEAASCFERVIALDPKIAEAHNNLGNALQAMGKFEESLGHYRRALELRPNYPEAASNLGSALHGLARLEEAEAMYRRALEMNPRSIEARGNMANLLMARGREADAVVAFRELLADAPRSAETWNNLGNALQALGHYEEAYRSFDEALRIRPAYAAVHNNIGNALRRQGRYEEALGCYERALAADPASAEAINNFAVVLQDMGRGAEAISHFERAAALRPSYADPLINLSNVWRDHGRPQRAIGYLRQALAVRPDNAYIWNNLGCSLGDQGEVPEAIECFEKALALAPSNYLAHANLLLNMHYLGRYGAERLAAAHREFSRRHEKPLAGLRRPQSNAPDPDRPLRVGYVSADFRRHSVAFFCEPLIERHDSAKYEAYCYSDVARPDAVTRRFQELTGSRWRDIRGYNHESFAQAVRADAIDILVDLAGHTANSRVLSFTLVPAPVQVTWLGYPNTTGLEAMNWRLTDAIADPPGVTDGWHSERLMRLDGGFLCFRAPAEAPAVSVLPSLSGQPFTYGSFNNMAKVNEETIETWARVLGAAPGSRLALKNRALSEPEARARVAGRFAAHGIAENRLMMSGLIEALAGHLDAYRMVDVALDTFPYHGTTTTFEALWMGVPVVSLVGDAHHSRVGASILGRLGLSEFLAADRDQYVAIAASLARPEERLGADLASLRAGLRARLQGSILTDEPGFARRVEHAYRTMWRQWCAQHKGY